MRQWRCHCIRDERMMETGREKYLNVLKLFKLFGQGMELKERLNEEIFRKADTFSAYVFKLGVEKGLDTGIAREVSNTAGTAWVTGYAAAVKDITDKVHGMCNQKQIVEYLESIKI